MNTPKRMLKDANTIHIMVELVRDGRAGIIEELAHLEPINIDELIGILKNRSGYDYGRNIAAWSKWFLEDKSASSAQEKEVFQMMVEFDSKWKEVISRF